MAGNYDKYGNYDFSMFEQKPVSFDHNAARKIATLPGVGERTADSGMRLVTRKKKTTVEAKNEMRATALRAAKVLTVAAVLLSLFAALLYSKLRVDELDRQIAKTESNLTAAQAETVRLNMQLDSTISLEKVDDYAQNVLGMVKAENYQIEYIDLSGDDKVTVSGGKASSSDSKESKSLITKLLEYIHVK